MKERLTIMATPPLHYAAADHSEPKGVPLPRIRGLHHARPTIASVAYIARRSQESSPGRRHRALPHIPWMA